MAYRYWFLSLRRTQRHLGERSIDVDVTEPSVLVADERVDPLDRPLGPLGYIAFGVVILLSLAALGAVSLAGGGTGALVTAAVAAATLTLILTYDYAGSTPVEGGAHFEERGWRVVLDFDRCRGVYSCWEVCPEACFEKREDVRKVELAYDDRCIRCGACVV